VVIVVVAALVMVVMKPVSRSHEDLQTETKHMCKKCGGEVGPSDGFCTKCGERIAG
jgi:predicted amidophosphoribosyltransferase